MAAQLQIPSILPFSPHGESSQVAQKWSKWKKSFQYFVTASGVRDDGRRKALLLHLVGLQTQEIFETLGVAEDATYQQSLDAFDGHFDMQRNVSFERSVFHNAKQKENESIEQYVTRLRRLAQYCEYNDIVEEQIRDQVVATCTSSTLRKRLLVEARLTLQRVRELGRAEETSKLLAHKLESPEIKQESLQQIASRGGNTRGSFSSSRGRMFSHPSTFSTTSSSSHSILSCTRCGAKGHQGNECRRSRGKKCLNCGKVGHFSVVCRSSNSGSKENSRRNQQMPPKPQDFRKYNTQKINQLHAEFEDDEDVDFFCIQEDMQNGEAHMPSYTYKDLFKDYPCNAIAKFEDVLFQVDNTDTQGQFPIKLNKTVVSVLIDSGSTLNLINSEIYKTLQYANPLQNSDTRIFVFQSDTPLKVDGKFLATVSAGYHKTDAIFHVVKGNGPSILSRATSERLDLLRVGPPPEIGSIQSNSFPVDPNINLLQVNHLIPQSTQTVVDKYPELFKGIGCYKNFAVKLHIDKSITPIQQAVRRIPFHTREKVSNEIKRLEKMGIIERVNGPTTWINPIVPVAKPHNAVRICLDMRRANEAIVRERHVIPKIDEIITELHGAKYFSKIDLREAYHQILLDDSSRDITTFGCHEGLFRYKRLVYGCKTAFEIFQRIVELTITGCDGARNISDDILLWGSSLDQLDQRTDVVFNKLLTAGFRVNLRKCVFGVSELIFAGHVLSDKGVSLIKDKVVAIDNISAPKNVSEVKSFLGMVSYCHQFVQNYSTISSPLRKLTCKQQPFVWGEEQKKAFQELKDALIQAETMAFYNPSAETRITVDASPVGLGAILSQQQEDGAYKPIYYGSRSLTDVESRYSQTEREALAVVWACEYFHFYIFDHKVTIYTDHKPLLSLLSAKSKPPPRIERWLLRLQAYTYKMEYVTGNKNSADCLSRNPQLFTSVHLVEEHSINMIVSDAIPHTYSKQEIVEATSNDEMLVNVMQSVITGKWSPERKKSPFFPIRQQLSIKDGILLKQQCIVVPKSLQPGVLSIAHKCHQGVIKTMSLLREKVWWSGIRGDVEKKILVCHGCQVTAVARSKCEPLQMTPCPPKPFHLLAVDIKGPLSSGDYLLAIIDYYSRFPFIFILRNTDSSKIITSACLVIQLNSCQIMDLSSSAKKLQII